MHRNTESEAPPVYDNNEDPDGDGLDNRQEYDYGTNPLSADSDSDGVSDPREISVFGTDPNCKDSEDSLGAGGDGQCNGAGGDGISDGLEINIFGTSPLSSQADSDGDGCSDAEELGDNPTAGGLRDPFNRYDYFNPSHDGQNRVDDITLVVNQYHIDAGSPNYNPDTDRTLVPNLSLWNTGPPNGLQRVDDILNMVQQYYHDCS